MMKPKIILFGATGFTGHLVAEALVERQLRPILCGRNNEKLERLAKQLGGLDTAIADVQDNEGLTALLSKGDVLISTVGPFVQYGRSAVTAAVKKGAIYIDSTGEPAFIQKVFETYGPEALSTGACLIPACGYDYIPGNCAAGLALQAAGSKAVRVDIGYFSKKNGRIASLDVSQGTQASLRLAMVYPIKVWRSGKLVLETGGIHVRDFDIDHAAHPALSVSCTEHFSLPRIYPELNEINTYLGWFGKHTRWMQRAARMQSYLSIVPGYSLMAKWMFSLLPRSNGIGPDAEQRKDNISHIVAEAFSAQGDLLSRREMVGVDGYTFTSKFIAWAAEKAIQGKVAKTGAVGPVEAFGLDALNEGCKEAGLETPMLQSA